MPFRKKYATSTQPKILIPGEIIMEILIVVAVIVAGWMVGCELAIAALIHPTLNKLPDGVHLPVASAIARVLRDNHAVLVQPYAFAYVS